MAYETNPYLGDPPLVTVKKKKKKIGDLYSAYPALPGGS
jgi:hypothetical protein